VNSYVSLLSVDGAAAAASVVENSLLEGAPLVAVAAVANPGLRALRAARPASSSAARSPGRAAPHRPHGDSDGESSKDEEGARADFLRTTGWSCCRGGAKAELVGALAEAPIATKTARLENLMAPSRSCKLAVGEVEGGGEEARKNRPRSRKICDRMIVVDGSPFAEGALSAPSDVSCPWPGIHVEDFEPRNDSEPFDFSCRGTSSI
jgi:hypothetical protein